MTPHGVNEEQAYRRNIRPGGTGYQIVWQDPSCDIAVDTAVTVHLVATDAAQCAAQHDVWGNRPRRAFLMKLEHVLEMFQAG